MNRGIAGLPRGDGRDPSRPWATSLQATSWSSSSAVMSPARLLDALIGWSLFLPSGVTNTSGGGTTIHDMQLLADSGSSAGGATTLYTPSNGGITTLMSPQGGAVDWTKPRYMCVRIRREATAASAGFCRIYYGWLTSSAPGVQPTGKSIGFELRGTAPRLWLIAHNGTTLTQVDSGWDVPSSSENQNEFLLESNVGTVSVYVDGVLRAITSGGPTNRVTGDPHGINYQVGNGGSSARTAMFISAARFTT